MTDDHEPLPASEPERASDAARDAEVAAALRAVQPVDPAARTAHLARALAAFDALELGDDAPPAAMAPVSVLRRRRADRWGSRLAVAAGLVVVVGLGTLWATDSNNAQDSSSSAAMMTATDAELAPRPAGKNLAGVPATPATPAPATTTAPRSAAASGGATPPPAGIGPDLGTFADYASLGAAARRANTGGAGSAVTRTTSPATTETTTAATTTTTGSNAGAPVLPGFGSSCSATAGVSPLWPATVDGVAVVAVVDPLGVRILDARSCTLLTTLPGV
jgi:hypothetical protein